MKDYEPLIPRDERPSDDRKYFHPLKPDEEWLEFWSITSKEQDEVLDLRKAPYRIFDHIGRRTNKKTGWCFSGIKEIARITHTHPVYVRQVIRLLIGRKLIERQLRPGRESLHRRTNKRWYFENKFHQNPTVEPVYEEDKASVERILWARLWTVCPDAPRSVFKKKMKEDPELFDRVLNDLENQIEESKEGKQPIPRNLVGTFLYRWGGWKKDKKKP